MSDLKIEKHIYKNFGECLKITNGIVEAFITIDFGPRVIYFGFPGGENFFHEDIDRASTISGEITDAIFGKGSKWFIYGGHRLWASPEEMPLTYYPDNDRVVWSEIPGGVELIPAMQRVTDLQYRIEVIFSNDKPKLNVKHYITNIGDAAKRRAAWAISVLSPGGLEVVPQPLNDTGLLANRVLSIWPYSVMSDERVYWGKKYITLRQDPSISSAFKFGINNLRGWAAYFNHGGLFFKKYESSPSGNYPDYGTSFETYTNNYILEMETLGELVDITPGSTIYHGEEWMLIENVERPAPEDEVTIDEIVKLYIEK
jgi:hypothetical protein